MYGYMEVQYLIDSWTCTQLYPSLPPAAAQNWASLLHLLAKHGDDLRACLLANANAGGVRPSPHSHPHPSPSPSPSPLAPALALAQENVHRGLVLGALVGAQVRARVTVRSPIPIPSITPPYTPTVTHSYPSERRWARAPSLTSSSAGCGTMPRSSTRSRASWKRASARSRRAPLELVRSVIGGRVTSCNRDPGRWRGVGESSRSLSAVPPSCEPRDGNLVSKSLS